MSEVPELLKLKEARDRMSERSEPYALSVRQLAERWACSPELIYDMIRRKELPAFRAGRLLRISRAVVEEKERTTQGRL